MNAVSFAGGGSQGSYWVGWLSIKNKVYDVYRGTSVGAFIALFKALERIDSKFGDILVHEFSNTSNRGMYGIVSPIDKRGHFREKVIAAYFFRPQNYLFDISKSLDKKISRHFKKEHFDELIRQGIEVIVTSNNIDIIQEPTKYISNLAEGMTFDLFKKYVLSSGAIPLLSKPVDILGFQHLDGGITDNSPTKDIDQYDSIDLFLCSSIEDDLEYYKKASTKVQVLMSTVMKARIDQARDDIARVEKHKNGKVFKIDGKLGFNSADFDSKKMRKAIEQGKMMAKL